METVNCKNSSWECITNKQTLRKHISNEINIIIFIGNLYQPPESQNKLNVGNADNDDNENRNIIWKRDQCKRSV